MRKRGVLSELLLVSERSMVLQGFNISSGIRLKEDDRPSAGSWESIPDSAARRVVVIDDYGEILDLLRIVLEEIGYQVVTSADGPGAFGLIRDQQPDLVILDLVMPGVGCWEILDALRQDPDTAAIPILVCSAALVDPALLAEHVTGAGCAVLAKPFDLDELLETIELLTAGPGRRIGRD